MVLLSVGSAPGNLPGTMSSASFNGIDLSKRTPAAAAAWREKAKGVQESSAGRGPRPPRPRAGRRWIQTLLPNSYPDFAWPDDVLKLVWDHVRRVLHATLKPRLFAEVHAAIHARGPFSTVHVYEEDDELDQRLFGVGLYCETCGSRCLVASADYRFHSFIPGTDDDVHETRWRCCCESCDYTWESQEMHI